jgi:hypothetical protein
MEVFSPSLLPLSSLEMSIALWATSFLMAVETRLELLAGLEMEIERGDGFSEQDY